jgi:hypothetical protein
MGVSLAEGEKRAGQADEGWPVSMMLYNTWTSSETRIEKGQDSHSIPRWVAAVQPYSELVMAPVQVGVGTLDSSHAVAGRGRLQLVSQTSCIKHCRTDARC